MKQLKNCILVFITGVLLLGSVSLHAAQVKFSIIPTSGTTTFLLPPNFTETVSYQVTNQTKVTRTLTIVPMQGITQVTTGGGDCQYPFTLSPQQSCSLSLAINASQVPAAGVSGGPMVCKTMGPNDPTPDLSLCSVPDPASILAVSVTAIPGQHVYVANQLSNTVSFCQVNPVTGFLSQCAITATGLNGLEGIGFNPAGNFFYSSNVTSNTISVCQVNATTGALSGCTNAGGTGFNLPDAITFSPDGSIFYTSNFGGGGSVSACLVNPVTGGLSSCVNNTSPTFATPANMVVNSSGTLAYVANRTTSTVSVCNVSGQTVNSCNAASGNFINGPEGVTLSPSGKQIFVANAGSEQVTVCQILQDGTGLLSLCSITSGPFTGTGNIGLNLLGTQAYVPNQLLSAVFVCNVSPIDGSLSSCLPTGGTGFNGPAGVVLR
jgi:DNA-binding beta-propeller fold protein YncE